MLAIVLTVPFAAGLVPFQLRCTPATWRSDAWPACVSILWFEVLKVLKGRQQLQVM